MLMEKLGLKEYETAKDLLLKKGSVKKAIESFRS
jgi:N-acetylmuramic acid 6-phosphate etherase